jgi:hypothetical protein
MPLVIRKDLHQIVHQMFAEVRKSFPEPYWTSQRVRSNGRIPDGRDCLGFALAYNRREVTWSVTPFSVRRPLIS